MKTTALFQTILTAIMLTALPAFVIAQDSFEDEVEQLPNKKLEKRGERISGPITSIAAAGLLFASYDKNADYTVTAAELSQGQTASFKTADKDSSGSLSLFELEDWRKAALGSLDAPPGNISFDKDYDQRVTQAEFEHALSYVYNANDKDDNGQLSFEEMTHVFEMPRRPIFEERPDNLADIDRQRPPNQRTRR